jgi:diguanylate cyclase (GGDEF)-like protein
VERPFGEPPFLDQPGQGVLQNQVVSSILIVDDDPGTVQMLGKMLSALGELRFALSGQEALNLARAVPPDLVVLDAEMPGLSGFEVCQQFKRDRDLAHIPLIFVTSHSDTAMEVAGLSAGAVDFISKPLNPPLVIARVRMQLRLKYLSDGLRRAALTDSLTGVGNRRRFDEQVEKEWMRAVRLGEHLSLLMIDIDYFKRYNDRYGHLAGDGCLRKVAEAIVSVARRPADEVARFGGEEFVMLLPHTDEAGAKHIAAHVAQAVADLRLPHDASPLGGVVTVSVGATTADGTGYTGTTEGAIPATELVAACDKALYQAKEAGRARSAFVPLALESMAADGLDHHGVLSSMRPAAAAPGLGDA